MKLGSFPLHFVSCLPRSGSTLLMNLLGQNLAHHVTPTNDLIEMVINCRNQWMNLHGFKAQGLENVKPRVVSVMRHILYGFFENEFENGQVVFDKSRGWFAYIELLEELLGRQIKILTTVRDVRAIVASFEKLNRKSAIARPDVPAEFYAQAQTIHGRAGFWLNQGGTIGMPINRFRDALNRGLGDRILVIPYNRLASEPQEMMDQVHDFLDLPRFTYDPTNVKQITHEDDLIHGFEHLHTIRPKVEPAEKDPWLKILPSRLCSEIAQEYRDINDIANGK